jgi:hypothetical protein
MPTAKDSTPIVYPGDRGHPHIGHYRILVDQVVGARTVVIHLKQRPDDSFDLMASQEARDAILNRLLDQELRGVRMEFIHFVAEAGGLAFTFAIQVDIHDYEARGNPLQVSESDAGGTEPRTTSAGIQPRAIHSRHLVAGNARVFTDTDKRMALTPELLALIRQ